MSTLPKGQEVSVELWPDGTVTYLIHEECITQPGAEALEVALSAARDAYHQAWDLPMVPAAALTH